MTTADVLRALSDSQHEEIKMLKAQRDALARAAEMMLAEVKNDISGEYSSPATRALHAALALARPREPKS